MVATLIFSGAPINQQFWGMFGRNNGLLSYLSCVLVMLGTASIKMRDFYGKLLRNFLVTSVFLSLYSLIQTLNLDPIKWSTQQAFATLGNINFLSAFLGMSGAALVAFSLNEDFSKIIRFLLVLISFVEVSLAYSTGSIQGPMIYIASSGVVVFIYLNYRLKNKLLKGSYILIGTVGLIYAILGLRNTGPLAKFLFQPSVLYREDYWHAGWVMTLKHPLFGVGMDSYGDWYREYRGSISTLRTFPDRVANTAHNIFLDISSSGGFPLIVSYLSILFIVIRLTYKSFKSNKKYDPILTGLFASWLAFQIQSLISIAQIGVTIWGWIFSGALIGYNLCINKVDNNEVIKSKLKNRRISKSLPPSTSLIALLGFVVGIMLSYPPFAADAQFKSSWIKRDLLAMKNASFKPGSTAYLHGLVLQEAIQSGVWSYADEINRKLNKHYPRDWYGWKALYLKQSSTPQERQLAIRKMRELDPYNPEIPKS